MGSCGAVGIRIGNAVANAIINIKWKDFFKNAFGIADRLLQAINGALEGFGQNWAQIKDGIVNGIKSVKAEQWEKLGTDIGKLIFPDPVDAGNKGPRVIAAELIGAYISRSVLAEKVFRIDLAAAQHPQHFRREIQIGPLVVPHLSGAGKPVHAEGRENEQLIGLELKQAVFDAHEFAAADVEIEFKIVMAVELRDFHRLIEIMMRLVALVAGLSHRQKGYLVCFSMHKKPPKKRGNGI